MPIIRANDPNASDLKHNVCTILGKLCDHELSVATQKDLMDKLTTLLKGQPATEATFQAFDLQCKIFEDEQTKVRTLMVHIPKKYVAASIDENRDDQWIQFTINRALNLDFHDSDKDERE